MLINASEGTKFLDMTYPIGSIYMSLESESPAKRFGGIWEQIKGKFLLGQNDTYAAGSTGGEATHKLTTAELAAHAHKPTTATVNSTVYPDYAFTLNRHFDSVSTARRQVSAGSGIYVMGAATNATDYVSVDDITQSTQTASTGGGQLTTICLHISPYIFGKEQAERRCE